MVYAVYTPLCSRTTEVEVLLQLCSNSAFQRLKKDCDVSWGRGGANDLM